MQPKSRFLVALDFDFTVVTHEQGIIFTLQKLFPGRVIPDNLQHILATRGWKNGFVPACFSELVKRGIPKSEIVSCLQNIPLTSGMQDLVHNVSAMGGTIVIISDNYIVPIHEVVKRHEFHEKIVEVHGIESHLDEEGHLIIKEVPFEEHFNCNSSTRLNGCKGARVHDCRTRLGPFHTVVFAGDGTNDACAMVALKHTDIAMVRRNYDLDKKLNESPELQSKIKAKLMKWDSGDDILQTIKDHLTILRDQGQHSLETEHTADFKCTH